MVENAKELFTDFLLQLGLDAEINIEVVESDSNKDITYLNVNLVGDNLSELIGYHGKNLEAIQVIWGLMLRKTYSLENDVRVLLDVNNYLDARKTYLKSLALRASEQVRNSGQEMELPPMKPSERRVVHMILAEEKGIRTESTGEGEDRKIIIYNVN